MAIAALEGLDDTIVAQATAQGAAALAIVRLSGARSLEILDQLAPGHRARQSHRLVRVLLRDAAGQALDDAMVAPMLQPRSYTGEDMVEFYLHGSAAVVQGVVDACLAAGARAALAGEFTQRAVYHGRLDLAQAEAVVDLLQADAPGMRQAAVARLTGDLSRLVQELLAPLEAILAAWRAAMDFPDYDTGEGMDPAHPGVLQALVERLARLLAQARLANTGGRLVVLCGAPNVGKSSLLNAWAGEPRVLTDARAGTTRDPVEVTLGAADGETLQVCDTAGLRQDPAAGDLIEQRGMQLTQRWAQRASRVLWLVAGDQPEWPPADLPVHAAVGSKADLTTAAQRRAIEAAWAPRRLPFLGWIVAPQSQGTGALLAALQGLLHDDGAPDSAPSSSTTVLRQRHLEALRGAQAHVERVVAGIAAATPLDMLAYDLQLACAHLGNILGRDVDAAVFEKVFAEFCIGK